VVSAADVVVHVVAAHRVGELTSALCRHLGLGADEVDDVAVVVARTGELLDADTAVGTTGLLSGDRLLLRRSVGPSAVPPSRPGIDGSWPSTLVVDVVAGPMAGSSLRVGTGRWSIGRGTDAHVRIDDPSVSRHHADVTIGPDLTVSVRPFADAAGAVTVNDDDIVGPVPVGPDDVVALGDTRVLVRPVRPGRDERPDRIGHVDFHRTPYRRQVARVGDVDPFGPIPVRPEPRRLQVFAVVTPLAAGIAMFAVTGHLQFLLLTLISPVAMVATSFEDRRSGRRTFRDEVAAFRDGLVEHRRRLATLRQEERIDRHRAAPDLADLIRRAEARAPDLWARGRSAADFLVLRLGLGSDRVRHPIELEPGGDRDLRDEALATTHGLGRVDHVPVVVDLAESAVLALDGGPRVVDGLLTSLVVQAATLHSPADLIVVAALSGGRRLGWVKWLPHVRSVTSPIPGCHLATTTPEADSLVRRLLDVIAFRRAESVGPDRPRRWPHVLAVLDGLLEPDPADVARLLDSGHGVGVSVIWLAPSEARVPRQATVTLTVDGSRARGGRLRSTDAAEPDREVELELLSADLADRAACALAPVRDASTPSQSTAVPRTAPLLDVLGVGRPTTTWVIDRWRRASGHSLRCPIGIGALGTVEVDLVHDGPHALIGGTSGSGKSELLQSIVATLAAGHPPARLNLLFVDYKGGATSQVFRDLPHTVGVVTNLTAALSRRALVSLRAELDTRMTILEGRAKDLAEMLEVAPADAPPSLVIVVDEFATLVKEVPEFVAGVVDIAQRGRSLGIHLVLATQRPSGSVDENILANTNLRISLRMLDRAESTAIIDSPDAADIPVPLRGRGLIRLGPRRLLEFQSAFGGAPVVTRAHRPPVLVGSFERPDDSPVAEAPGRHVADRGGPTDLLPPPTHLAVLLDAISSAAGELALAPPRRPWRDELPAIVAIGTILADPAAAAARSWPGRHVVVGLLDDPEHQDQRPAVVDLEEGGGLLVFGSGGSGKSTLLRSVAAGAVSAARAGGRPVAMVAFDFASRSLGGLRALPEMVDVAAGDDMEAVTRHLVVLDAELARRRRVLADADAEHLTAYDRGADASRPELPRIVVLIDGFGGLMDTLLDPSRSGPVGAGDEWHERLLRIVVDGRQVGIHTVITAGRRAEVPARVHAAISNRLILRHADDGSYAEHGVGRGRSEQLEHGAGRGLLQGTTLVQVAVVSREPGAKAQSAAIAALGGRPEASPATVLRSAPLPEVLQASDIAAAPSGRSAPTGVPAAVIGVADVTGRPVEVDLSWSDLTVAGPPRSGRSTALATVAAGLRSEHDVVVVGPPASPLGALALGRSCFGRPDELARFLEGLAAALALVDRDGPAPLRRPVLVVDDVDLLDDPQMTAAWERLARLDHLRVVAALETRALTGYPSGPMVGHARRARRQLVLQPADPSEFVQATGVRLPVRPGLRVVAGRGVLLTDRIPTVVQVARPSHPAIGRDHVG
jgi:S-DNA-T family DNA segregation ATPase FtsK/SpoIIIE